MRSYMVLSMGEEYGPYTPDYLRKKLAAGEFRPRTNLRILDDGNHGGYANVEEVILAHHDPADALATFQAYFAEVERVAKASPDFAPGQQELAIGYQKLGDAFSRQGQVADAVTNYRAGLAVMEKLVTGHPWTEHYLALLAELSFALAVNRDEPARRYEQVVRTLGVMARKLDKKQRRLLADASRALAKRDQS